MFFLHPLFSPVAPTLHVPNGELSRCTFAMPPKKARLVNRADNTAYPGSSADPSKGLAYSAVLKGYLASYSPHILLQDGACISACFFE